MLLQSKNNIKIIKTGIIPGKPTYVGKKEKLSLASISVFTSTGFFIDSSTYYEHLMCLQPAKEYTIDGENSILSESTYWSWNHNPREISLKQATEEFAHLFEKIINEQTAGKKVILPISGGLDSRTLAAALRNHKEVQALSYEFEGGLPETEYAKAVARAMGFDFKAFTVPRGYLWNKIEQLSEINNCYAEFTHPRQMAFFDHYAELGDMFLLGHWGDVLFDDMDVSDNLSFESQVDVVIKKIVKKGGVELAEALWKVWGLEGNFSDYQRSKVEQLLKNIHIDNANARIRAFKSMYWAPRWTSVNLQVFASVKPVALPYYHDELCKFICTVPEKWLAGRQIQIEYLKMVAPQLARIPWQQHKPFNLYTYQWNKFPWNLPYRFADKMIRTFRELMGRKFIQRNWELQFLGDENEKKLEEYLFENEKFKNLVPESVVREFYDKFTYENPVYYSHPVSMLLTLSMFAHKNL